MTELIFYKKPDLHIFTAEVVSTEITDKCLKIILDKTAFYPEGGGQPADRGTINGHPVVDVQKKDDIVYHYLGLDDNTDGKIDTENSVKKPLPAAGDKVEGIIDSEHRLDYMQQHTGQHVISAALMNTAGIQTVSVRQGSDYTAVETSASDISSEVLRLVEQQANSFITAGAPIIRHITDAEGLKNFNLRRPTKHITNVKIVEIQGVDCVACGGLHLANTAEIGLIKFIYYEKIRGHIRTFWKIGKRAYDDYAEKTEIINSLNEFYSARQFELISKAKAAEEQFIETRYKHNKLEEEYAALYASVLTAENQGPIVEIFDNKTKGFITSLIRTLAAESSLRPAYIFNRTEKNLTWAVSCSDPDFDFNSFKKDLLPIIDGKGGGKAPLWQGAARKAEDLPKLIENLNNSLL